MKDKPFLDFRPIESVTPYEGNARTHSKEQIAQIAASIREFGFVVPIVVDSNSVVIAGHGRLLAAQQIGLDRVPVIQADNLSPAQVRAYRIADNRLAEGAGWDEDLLRVEIKFLAHPEINFDVELMGFNATELDLLLIGSEPVEEEPVPELPAPEVVVTQAGDVWCLGRHRLICGDCREPSTLHRLMGEKRARIVLSDPPYNVRIDGHVSGLGKKKHREFPMASGELSPEDYVAFLQSALRQLRSASVEGSLHFIFMDWRHLGELLTAGYSVYDELINLCVWVKSNGGMGSLYRSQHELIMVFKAGTAPHSNNVQLGRHGRYRTNVWHYAGVNAFSAERDEALAMHPTVKPVALLADAIRDVTSRSDIVLDGFLGSGSTLIAAQKTGRTCYGVEIDPAYVDVILERYERSTGKSPRRQRDDARFADLRARAHEEVSA